MQTTLPGPSDSSLDDQLKLVRKKNLCINCSNPGHFVRNCQKKSFCKIKDCSIKHSTFLHKPALTSIQQPSQPDTTNSIKATNAFAKSSQAFSSAKHSTQSIVFIPVVPVRVKGKGQVKDVVTYALLDSGSNTSFCTEALLNKLELKGSRSTLSLTTLHREKKTIHCSIVSLAVSPLDKEDYIELPMVYSGSSLPISKENIGSQEDVDKWPQLHGVQIPSVGADIGLLIGNDVPDVLHPKEVKPTREGGPYAARSVLGWTINGPLKRKYSKARTSHFASASTTDKLSEQFTKYCNLEFNDSSYETQLSMSQNDIKALDIMSSSISLVNGHYQLALPWKAYPPRLQNNKSMAENRVTLLKKRLQRSPATLTKYRDFMNDLLVKNYAQRIAQPSDCTAAWYLPHHPVFHPQKPDFS